jgi:hypothetical protein
MKNQDHNNICVHTDFIKLLYSMIHQDFIKLFSFDETSGS